MSGAKDIISRSAGASRSEGPNQLAVKEGLIWLEKFLYVCGLSCILNQALAVTKLDPRGRADKGAKGFVIIKEVNLGMNSNEHMPRCIFVSYPLFLISRLLYDVGELL